MSISSYKSDSLICAIYEVKILLVTIFLTMRDIATAVSIIEDN